MQDFINFIVGNWQFVSTCAISIVSFILLLVFRRYKIVDNSLTAHLAGWIDEAERLFSDGADKKQYVMDKAKTYLGENYHPGLISVAIENILSLPQKKGK